MNVEDFISKDDWTARTEPFVPNKTFLSNISKLNSKLVYELCDFSDDYANIFIFGIPRSGTTLASQLIAEKTNLGYINNLIASFWENPQYGVYLSRHLAVGREISYASELGKTYAVGDISEFGYFWAPLLGHKTAARLGENKRSKINWPVLANKVLSINHAFTASCVFKNVLLGHYIKELNDIFKSPLFIYVKRTHLDAAYSILKAREKRYGNISHWLSTKPYEYEELKKLGPHEQIAAQIYYLEKDFETQLKGIAPNRLLVVDYDNLCKEPDLFLADVQLRLNEMGHAISIKSAVRPLVSSSVESKNNDVFLLERSLNQYYS